MNEAPHFQTWPVPAAVTGDTSARGVAVVDRSGRRDGYEGERNVEQGIGGGQQFDGRQTHEDHTAPPAAMFDPVEMVRADVARRYRLDATNPQGAAAPPQAGQGGYVLVGEPGARLAQYSTDMPSPSWSPAQARPVATTIDGAPLAVSDG